MAECTLLETISFSFYKTISAVAQNEENTTDLIVHSWLKCVVIRGYVPQGAGFYCAISRMFPPHPTRQGAADDPRNATLALRAGSR